MYFEWCRRVNVHLPFSKPIQPHAGHYDVGAYDEVQDAEVDNSWDGSGDGRPNPLVLLFLVLPPVSHPSYLDREAYL